MENRIEQFEFEGKKFIYYDLSHLKNNMKFFRARDEAVKWLSANLFAVFSMASFILVRLPAI
jgi:hypothetical protein